MGTAPLLRVLILTVAACKTSPVQCDALDWAEDAWVCGDVRMAQVSPANLTDKAMSLTVRLPAEEPAGRAAEVLVAGLERDIARFRLGVTGDPALYDVLPPPSRSAARAFAVLSVRPEGVTLSSSGGAELAVPCGACAVSSDWTMDGVAKALNDADVDEVLVVFSPTTPWNAVLSAVRLAGDRTVRIARG